MSKPKRDDTTDSTTDAVPVTTPAPSREPARKAEQTKLVLVDYIGGRVSGGSPQAEADLEPAMARRRARVSERFGARVRPHELAPLIADPKADGKPLGARLVLRPGLNLVDAKVWAANTLKAEPGKKPGPVATRVAAGEIVVLDALPKNAEAIIDLAERTACPVALDALRKHEVTRRGGSKGEHARDHVVEAIEQRSAVVGRAPGARGVRLDAKVVERRFKRLRAS